MSIRSDSQILVIGALLSLCVCIASPNVKGDDAKNGASKIRVQEDAETRNLRGELVLVDHVNRRGSLRLQIDGHFREGKLHHFAMLPDGLIYYHGAPAALRDIPLGTILYGRFAEAPDPQSSVVPIPSGRDVTQPRENHALLLEDGLSYCLREGLHWKLNAVELKGMQGILETELPGTSHHAGLHRRHQMTVDESTRIWRGRELLSISDLISEGLWPEDGRMSWENQSAFLGLTWHPRYLYQQYHVADIWLDQDAVEAAGARQRARHRHHIRQRWMPAWVDRVEHGEFGQGVVTVRLFGGMDSELYADFRPNTGGKMAAAETTLRTWWPDHDGMDGRIVAIRRDVPEASSQNSGIEVDFEVPLILEGFRPGRIVRIRPQGWPNVKPPFEERIRSLEDRWPSPDFFRR